MVKSLSFEVFPDIIFAFIVAVVPNRVNKMDKAGLVWYSGFIAYRMEKTYELQERIENPGKTVFEAALCPVGSIMSFNAGFIRESSVYI